jgi:hypothetical protein
MQRSVATAMRWSWLLGVALLVPAALPAGGAERRQPQIRRRDGNGPLISGHQDWLHAAPSVSAPSLRRLDLGTPLRVLRRWRCADGQEWLQVQVASTPSTDQAGKPQRGWLHG